MIASSRDSAVDARFFQAQVFLVSFAIHHTAMVTFDAPLVGKKIVSRVFLWHKGERREEEEKHRLDYAAFSLQFSAMVQHSSLLYSRKGYGLPYLWFAPYIDLDRYRDCDLRMFPTG